MNDSCITKWVCTACVYYYKNERVRDLLVITLVFMWYMHNVVICFVQIISHILISVLVQCAYLLCSALIASGLYIGLLRKFECSDREYPVTILLFEWIYLYFPKYLIDFSNGMLRLALPFTEHGYNA